MPANKQCRLQSKRTRFTDDANRVLYLLSSFLFTRCLLCRRLFTRFRYDLLTIFQCQGSWVGYRFRNTIVRFLIRDIRTKTTFQDFHLRIFLKLLDKPLFVFSLLPSIRAIASSAVIVSGFKSFGIETNLPS